MTKKITRRSFVRKSVNTAITAGALSTIASCSSTPWTRPLGANGDIRIAIVGCNSHGAYAHLRKYLKMPGVRVVALCDPDRRVLRRETEFLSKQNINVDTYTDIRNLLERKDVDAISGATPNHWHALSSVWACQAGKHVCVEKPVSHNIWEGRKIVEAGEKYNRLVQADLDKRSNEANDKAIEYIQKGKLGKVKLIHAWVYKRRKSIGLVSELPAGHGVVDKEIDYDLWCGPAPKIPLPRKDLHYKWHWQWDYGNGEIGNNGPHMLDACRWVLGEPGMPKRVMTVGGRFGYIDDGQTPNTSITLYEYDDSAILFEVRGLPRKAGDKIMDPYFATSKGGIKISSPHNSGKPNNGLIVICEDGYVNMKSVIGGNKERVIYAYDRNGKVIEQFTGGGISSAGNFIKALRSGKQTDLRTTIENGHISTSLCHLGNISYRIGSSATVDEINGIIKEDPQAMDAVERMREHLLLNNIDLAKTPVTIGPMLTFDSKTEKFTGEFGEGANKLVKRKYREPFVIREKV